MKNMFMRSVDYSAEEKNGKKYITGILPYNKRSVDMGFYEVISPTAFNKTLADKSNVRALVNHDTSKVLGSTKSGTLELRNSPEGLVCTVEVPNTSYGNDLFEVVSRGDCNNMSFRFMPVKYEDKGGVRTLKEIMCDEVSFGVMDPAYPDTDSTTFKRSIELYMEKREIDMEKVGEALKAVDAKAQLTDEQVAQLKSLVESLSSLIPASPKEQPTPPKEEPKPEPKPEQKPEPKVETDTLAKDELEKQMLMDELDDELNSKKN